MRRFTDDSIRRKGLPRDVFKLLHDLCYHHERRDIGDYVRRAQTVMSADTSADFRDETEITLEFLSRLRWLDKDAQVRVLGYLKERLAAPPEDKTK